jgi:hypothetical protein
MSTDHLTTKDPSTMPARLRCWGLTRGIRGEGYADLTAVAAIRSNAVAKSPAGDEGGAEFERSGRVTPHHWPVSIVVIAVVRGCLLRLCPFARRFPHEIDNQRVGGLCQLFERMLPTIVVQPSPDGLRIHSSKKIILGRRNGKRI